MTEKKKYEAPRMKAYQLAPLSVICASTQSTTEQLQEEVYTW